MLFDDVDPDVMEAAAKIRLFIMDCDGVLTDGRLYYSGTGEELKAFDVKDGQGIVSLIRKGIPCAVITARKSAALELRASELGIKTVVQNSKDKAESLKEICTDAGISPDEVAYIGDDITDIPAMRVAGLPISVGDAVAEVQAAALYVSGKPGGRGAVREASDLILAAQNKGFGEVGSSA